MTSEKNIEAGDLEVLNRQLFFDRYKGELEEMFCLAGLPDGTTGDLETAVNNTQQFTQGDHSRPGYNLCIKTGDETRLHELYKIMGLRDEVSLLPGDYHEIIVPGAVQYGNLRRLSLLARSLNGFDGGTGPVTTQRVRLLGGQRRLFPEVEKDDIEHTFAEIYKNVKRGILSPDPWVDQTRRTEDVGELWETDGLRLAAIAKLGKLSLHQIVLRMSEDVVAGVDPRHAAEPLVGYEFTYGDIAVSLLHTLAVPRPNGAARHTTEACIQDWLNRYEPPQGATIGFIGANPHLERMTRATRRVLVVAGRNDLQLVAAGSAAPERLGHGHFFGEVARNLFEDRQYMLSQNAG